MVLTLLFCITALNVISIIKNNHQAMSRS